MKTLHAYISTISNTTVKFSNQWLDGDSVKHSYWAEDFTSEPDIKSAVPASFNDIEARCEHVDERRAIVNLCQ